MKECSVVFPYILWKRFCEEKVSRLFKIPFRISKLLFRPSKKFLVVLALEVRKLFLKKYCFAYYFRAHSLVSSCISAFRSFFNFVYLKNFNCFPKKNFYDFSEENIFFVGRIWFVPLLDFFNFSRQREEKKLSEVKNLGGDLWKKQTTILKA